MLVRRICRSQPCTLAIPNAGPFTLFFAQTLCVPFSLCSSYMRERDRPLTVHFRFGLIELKFLQAQRIWSSVIFGRIGASRISRNGRPYFLDFSVDRRSRRLSGDSQKQERQE